MNNANWSIPTYKICLITLLSVVILSACKPSPSSEKKQETTNATAASVEISISTDPELATLFANQLWQQGLNALEVVQAESKLLQNSVKELLAEPNDTTLSAAHAQWARTFLLYQELLPFLFIEHASLTPFLAEWRFTLAAWPLQPGYLDSYDIYIQSGITNDITLPITLGSLRKQNGLTDAEEVTLGLYAIEYLLWGDKQAVSPTRFLAQNKVPLLFEQAGLKVNELPNNRRRQLLAIQIQLFTDDLSLLKKQWQARGALNNLFTKLTSNDKLFALHNGLLTQLNEMEKLLAYKVEISESGVNKKSESAQKNIYPDRFNKIRQQAIKKKLASIQTLYFANINVIAHNTKNTISLATLLLSPVEKQELALKIEDIKKQLTE